MLVYKDVITGDEMFVDTYKIAEVDNGMFYEVEGKLITRTEEFDESKIGANASQEEMAEKTNESSVTNVDIVINHRLQEVKLSKESFMGLIRPYMKRIKEHLEQTNSKRVEQFVVDSGPVVKKIRKNFDRYRFYTGESGEEKMEGMLAILDYRDDDTTPFMLFFKDGLLAEKY